MTTVSLAGPQNISEVEYKRRIRAWTMYDWANSAFATTILAAILPIYYSQVAGSTLSSPAQATAYWSTGLSISTLIIAILSPLLGTISDVMRGKKLFLSIFWGLGIVTTGLLVLVSTGDWLLASLLFVLGRIGFNGANVFYDALLPHVAREADRDRVSTRGYAMGYLGGGILLAINVVMLQVLPGTWGAQLSFLSVAIWWGVFSIPLFRRVPEPPAAQTHLTAGESVISVSIKRMIETFRDVRRYRHLFLFVIAFLIYVDGIGTIIEIAAIYGAELGFGSTQLVLALLMVQFVGIPFSLIFGRLPDPNEKRRPFFLAFVLFNLVMLPLVGIAGRIFLPAELSGISPAAYESTTRAAGQGVHPVSSEYIQTSGEWQVVPVSAEQSGGLEDIAYLVSDEAGAQLDFAFNGQEVVLFYSTGPDHGIWDVLIDGQPLVDGETGEPMVIDAYHPTLRYEVEETFRVDASGEHSLMIINTGQSNPESQGTLIAISAVEVLPPQRQSSLLLVIGLILVVELVGLTLSYFLGPLLFSGLAGKFNTKNSILLALSVYSMIAVWGFFLDSVIEYWFLAWMVAVVQGGSQALSRSLFSILAPATKSGEFFGLFGVMEKFSAIVGPLTFAIVASSFGSSRPAILSIIAFFIIGGLLLTRVDVEAGRKVAQAEDAAMLGEANS